MWSQHRKSTSDDIKDYIRKLKELSNNDEDKQLLEELLSVSDLQGTLSSPALSN